MGDYKSIGTPVFSSPSGNCCALLWNVFKFLVLLNYGCPFSSWWGTGQHADHISDARDAIFFWVYICTSDVISLSGRMAKLRMGRLDDAIALYQRLLGHSNHLGLFSEMVDPNSGEVLGNFPQALTHLAVITTALELTHAIEEKGSRE